MTPRLDVIQSQNGHFVDARNQRIHVVLQVWMAGVNGFLQDEENKLQASEQLKGGHFNA